MIQIEEIVSLKDYEDFEESLIKYSLENELENEEQAMSFLNEFDEEKITKEISVLISSMEESTNDSINLHLSIINNNLDEEKEEIFSIINRGSSIPFKPRPIQSNTVFGQVSSLNESLKSKTSNILIHRPVPKKKI